MRALLVLLIAISAAAQPPPKKRCYRDTRTVVSGRYVGKLWDEKFVLKRGGFFAIYGSVLGLSWKKTAIGSYLETGDSLTLKFCGDTLPKAFTGTAFINRGTEEIIVFKKDPAANTHYRIEVCRR